MASELNALARDAARVAHQNPRTADFTQNILRSALCERLSPVFPFTGPMWTTPGRPSEADRRDLEWAMKQARPRNRQSTRALSISSTTCFRDRWWPNRRSGFSRHAVLALRNETAAVQRSR